MRANVLLILGSLVILSSAALFDKTNYSRTIVDVSWPNCAISADTVYEFGIIGVTGGRDFSSNPCLSRELTWFEHYALYINTGYPGESYGKKYASSPIHCSLTDSQCLAYNYGFNSAEYAISYSDSQSAYSGMWWLDVESDNSWTTNTLVNQASLLGAISAINQKVFLPTIGFYSSSYQWASITGQWQDGLPSWLATGGINAKTAANSCRDRAFTGGSIWLTQYTIKLDENALCSVQFEQHLSN